MLCRVETLGQRIRRLREERRWSQAELGDLVGVSGRTIGNWERDTHDPRNSIGALEKVFGVSLTTGQQLVGEQDHVVHAIEGSLLDRADRAELISHYWRLLDAAGAKADGGDRD